MPASSDNKVDKTPSQSTPRHQENPGAIADQIGMEKKGDIGYLQQESSGRVQDLKGFEPCYSDIVDYIIRCTHRIWEEKGVGVIYSHYAHNIPIWTSDGLTYGREIVVENTLKTLAAFPDCKLIGDEVIWCGNEEDGFHTSHRITWVAHNTGHSIYGPPTNKRVVRTGIANCFIKENRIVEEWIARDELGLVNQLGFDRDEVIQKIAGQSSTPEQTHGTGLPERSVGQFEPAPMRAQNPDESDICYFMKKSFYEIWNLRLLNKIEKNYHPNVICHTTCGRHLYGTAEYAAFVLALLAALPDAKLTVDQFYCMGDDEKGYKTMTRWSINGTHKGPGIYGDPTGKPVYLMGISHNRVKDNQILEEWTFFDEVALLKQIYTPEPCD